ncbi:hypothetical protein D3C84_545000 [compost metagenome]
MHRAAIAEQHHIGDVLRLETVAVKVRQLVGGRRIKNARAAAVQDVAHIEIDGLDQLSLGPQCLHQPRKKRRTDALQEQERVAWFHRYYTSGTFYWYYDFHGSDFKAVRSKR